MEGNQDECMNFVLEAAMAESLAVELDKKGDVQAAIAKYEECERKLDAAVRLAPTAHPEDHPKLVQHKKQITDRIQHLKSLNGKPPTIPVEDQIKAIQLGMQAHSAATTAASSSGGVKNLAAVAALGAGAGFIVLGGTIGGTLAVVGGAAAAGYCATRSDKVGDAARGAGQATLQGVAKARKINEKHDLTGKLVEAGSKACTAAKETDKKYGLSTKLCEGIAKAAQKVKEIEQKHHVTDKVAASVSTGIGKVSEAFDKRNATSSAPSK